MNQLVLLFILMKHLKFLERTRLWFSMQPIAHNIKLDKNGNLGGQNMRMHLLISGDKFDIKTKEVIK